MEELACSDEHDTTLLEKRMLTVLWDNDGILVDTEGLFFRATQTVLSSVGVELSPKQFIEYSLRRGESTFQLAAERGVSPDEINRLRAERDRLYADSLRMSECVVEGVEEALRRLHGHVRMGVVTSSRREHFEIAHANSGLLGFFEFVIAREDYEHSKPHPDPYLTALERHGLRSADCVAVEDSERGLAAATAAGVRCLAIPNEWTRNGDFRAAHRMLNSIGEVPEVVFQIRAAEERR